jgi:peptide deformylase
MPVLPIYLYGTEILRKKAKPIQSLDDSAIKLIYDMVDTMHKANGIGLAATQVGEIRQLIVIDQGAIERGEDETEEGKERPERLHEQSKTMVLINPEVVQDEGTFSMEEGCLSLPELRAEVTRPEKIRLRFRDANFEKTEMEADGLLARVMLHEIDHLNGVLFVDHLSPGRRALLRHELKKIKNGEVDTIYPVVSALEA